MTNKKGIVLIFVLVILVGLSLVSFAYLSMLSYEMKSVNAGLLSMQSFYIAEAGHAKARWALTTGTRAPGWGESNISFGNGTYTYTTAYSDPPTNTHVTITSLGYIPDSANPIAMRTVVEKNVLISAGSGTNFSLASGGTIATSSPYQGQNTPSQAIDGSAITGWISNVKATSWLALDYGSAKTIGKVVVSGSKINSIVVQYSADGIIWTPVSSPSGALPGTQTFTAVTTRYLRLNITSASSDKAQVNEFESYTGSSGTPGLGRGGFVTSQ